MQKARRKNVPPTPRNLREMADILEEYEPIRGVYRGCAVGVDGSLALVFIHESMIEPLSKCSQLFTDGTFKVKLSKDNHLMAHLCLYYFHISN